MFRRFACPVVPALTSRSESITTVVALSPLFVARGELTPPLLRTLIAIPGACRCGLFPVPTSGEAKGVWRLVWVFLLVPLGLSVSSALNTFEILRVAGELPTRSNRRSSVGCVLTPLWVLSAHGRWQRDLAAAFGGFPFLPY